MSTRTYRRPYMHSDGNGDGASTHPSPSPAPRLGIGTRYPEIFAALAAEFDPSELKWTTKTKSGTKKFTYVTARTVMNRLDEVLGPENWTDSYQSLGDAISCTITITLPDGLTLAKCDAGGPEFAMPDAGDRVKSGFSDAFKRAAAKFGVARYLYRDGVPDYSAQLPTEPNTNPEPTTATAPEGAKPKRPNPKNWDELRQRIVDFESRRGETDPTTSILRSAVEYARSIGAPHNLGNMNQDVLKQVIKHVAALINLAKAEGGSQ